jgi:hypothetical protein
MIPLFLDPSDPRIEDPSQPLDLTHWQPQDKRTSKLTRCLEALRDLTTAFRSIAENTSASVDKRLLKQSIPPLYNLATALRDLNNEIISNCPNELKDGEKKAIAHHFKIFGVAVPTTNSSPLKTARDKIAAHLDKDTQTPGYRDFWEQFELPVVADWIMGCIRMFTIFIQPDLYHWERNSGQADRYTVMRFDGQQVALEIAEGKTPELISVTLTRSPKEAIEAELRTLLALVTRLCPEAGKTEAYKALE